MLLREEQIQPEWFSNVGILHFCSVSLIDAPIQQAHRRAIALAQEKKALISFDPNIRLPLWNSPAECQARVREFLPCADIVKLSDEELEFVTGKNEITQAAVELFSGNCSVILYSMGKDGAMLLTPKGSCTVPNPDVQAKDTTGAGDAIIGALLFCLAEQDITKENVNEVTMEQWQAWLEFAVYYANYSVMGSGAITSYPDRETFIRWKQQMQQKG